MDFVNFVAKSLEHDNEINKSVDFEQRKQNIINHNRGSRPNYISKDKTEKPYKKPFINDINTTDMKTITDISESKITTIAAFSEPKITTIAEINESKCEINNIDYKQEVLNTIPDKPDIVFGHNRTDIINMVKEMTLEEIFVNINLISKIEVNDKLIINNKFINIDTTYIQPLTRWLYGNDRKSTLFFLNLIINKSFEYCDNILKEEDNNNNTKLLFRLTTEIKNSINGLLNLKQTYTCDKLVQAEIDVIVENIRTKIDYNTNNINHI
jgi:hypothetical protein